MDNLLGPALVVCYGLGWLVGNGFIRRFLWAVCLVGLVGVEPRTVNAAAFTGYVKVTASNIPGGVTATAYARYASGTVASQNYGVMSTGACSGGKQFPIGNGSENFPIEVWLEGSDGRKSASKVVASAQADCAIAIALDWNAVDPAAATAYCTVVRVNNQCSVAVNSTVYFGTTVVQSFSTPANSIANQFVKTFGVTGQTGLTVATEYNGSGQVDTFGAWNPCITLPGGGGTEENSSTIAQVTVTGCSTNFTLATTNKTTQPNVGAAFPSGGAATSGGAGGDFRGTNGGPDFGTNQPAGTNLLTEETFKIGVTALDKDVRLGFGAVTTNQALSLIQDSWFQSNVLARMQAEAGQFTNLLNTEIGQSNQLLTIAALGTNANLYALTNNQLLRLIGTNTSNALASLADVSSNLMWARTNRSDFAFTNGNPTVGQLQASGAVASASISNTIQTSKGYVSNGFAGVGVATNDTDGLHFTLPYAIGPYIGMSENILISVDPCDYGLVAIMLAIARYIQAGLVSMWLYRMCINRVIEVMTAAAQVPQARPSGQSVLGTNGAILESISAAVIITALLVTVPTILIAAMSEVLTGISNPFNALISYATSTDTSTVYQTGFSLGTSGISLAPAAQTVGKVVKGAVHFAYDVAPINAFIAAGLSYQIFKLLTFQVLSAVAIGIRWAIPAFAAAMLGASASGALVTNELVYGQTFDGDGKIAFSITNGNTYRWTLGGAYSIDWAGETTTTTDSGERVAGATGGAMLDTGNPGYSGLSSGDSVLEIYDVPENPAVALYGQWAAYAFGLGFTSAIVWEILGWSLRQLKAFKVDAE